MKQIQETKNKSRWPRKRVKSVECRKRDLVIRITDWLGVYDWNESKVFSRWTESGPKTKSPSQCKREAIAFAQEQTAKLL